MNLNYLSEIVLIIENDQKAMGSAQDVIDKQEEEILQNRVKMLSQLFLEKIHLNNYTRLLRHTL